MLNEVIVCKRRIEFSGPSLLHPSGIMGQGVYVRGNVAKWIIHVTVGKPNPLQPSGERGGS
jgi:hypothetical protein